MHAVAMSTSSDWRCPSRSSPHGFGEKRMKKQRVEKHQDRPYAQTNWPRLTPKLVCCYSRNPSSRSSLRCTSPFTGAKRDRKSVSTSSEGHCHHSFLPHARVWTSCMCVHKKATTFHNNHWPELHRLQAFPKNSELCSSRGPGTGTVLQQECSFPYQLVRPSQDNPQ